MRVFLLTMACEGRLRDPLDRATRRTHTQMPTFMAAENKKRKKNVNAVQKSSRTNVVHSSLLSLGRFFALQLNKTVLLCKRESLAMKVFAGVINHFAVAGD